MSLEQKIFTLKKFKHEDYGRSYVQKAAYMQTKDAHETTGAYK